MSNGETLPYVPTPDERTLALLAHLLQIISGWVGPLIILLIRRDSKFVSFHALQALLLQVAHLVLMIVLGFCGFFLFILFAMTPGSHVPSPFPMLMVPMFFLAWLGPWITIVVLGILYGMRANQGEWAEYPVLGALAKKFLHIGDHQPD